MTVVRQVPPRRHRVVVGIDGSVESAAATRRALIEARARHATLVAVAAWEPTDAALTAGFIGRHVPDLADLAEWARLRAQTVVDRAGRRPDDRVVVAVRRGGAARVLLGAADHADLLIVGTRRRGPLDRLLAGSVSGRCLHRAACPVQVVPAADSTANA